MRKYIIYLIVISFFGCKKEEVLPSNVTYEKSDLFIPFTDYRAMTGYLWETQNCTGLNGRTFLNLNKNSSPDLIISVVNVCAKTQLYVFIDGNLKWKFYSPQKNTRKMVKGDFNEDGIDDIVMFGIGDDFVPFPGEKNYIIFFKSDSYEIKELDNINQFTHSGSVGDVNNDGHIDVIPVPNQNKDCFVYLNDGKGNFTKKKIFDGSYTDISYSVELYDVNNDNKLDFILGGQEWVCYSHQIGNTRILLGNGDGSFDMNNPIIIPKVNGWGNVIDYKFGDFDKDGIDEMVIVRTSGSESSCNLSTPKKNPNGWYDDFRIQVLKKNSNSYVQTSLLISPSGYENTTFQWINWIKIWDVDKDGNLDILPDYENLNDRTNEQCAKFYGLYYKGDGIGNFTEYYKK